MLILAVGAGWALRKRCRAKAAGASRRSSAKSTAMNSYFGMTIAPDNTGSDDQPGNGRCPTCASKTEFCICDDAEIQRRTMSSSAVKVRVTRANTMQLDRKCAYVSDAGKDCRSMSVLPSLQCANHSCHSPGCFEPKSSAVQHCSRHRAAGPPATIDVGGYLVPTAGSNNPEYTAPSAAAYEAGPLYGSPAAAESGWWSASPDAEAESIYAQYGVGHASLDYETVDPAGTVGASTVDHATVGASTGAPAAKAISATGFELYRGNTLPKQAVEQFRSHKSRAMAILGNDPARYLKAWRMLLFTDIARIQALNTLCDRAQHRMLPKPALRQLEVPSDCPSRVSDDPAAPSYWKWILTKFKAHRPVINAGLAKIREVCGSHGTVRLGPAKSRERAEQKAELCYDGDMALVGDYERAEIVCKDVLTAHSVVDFLLAEGSPFPTVRVKNRFAIGYPATKESGGYRDVQLVGRIPSSGLLFEIQVHVKQFHAIKTELGTARRGGKTGHGRYRDYRDSKEKANRSLQELVQAMMGTASC